MTRGIVGVKTAIPFFAIHQEILTHAPTPTPPYGKICALLTLTNFFFDFQPVGSNTEIPY